MREGVEEGRYDNEQRRGSLIKLDMNVEGRAKEEQIGGMLHKGVVEWRRETD